MTERVLGEKTKKMEMTFFPLSFVLIELFDRNREKKREKERKREKVERRILSWHPPFLAQNFNSLKKKKKEKEREGRKTRHDK